MQIRFSHNSLLDWSDPGEGVQIFSEEITDDIAVAAVLPHPASSPDVASPAYYYFKSISTDREIQPSEAANLPAIAGRQFEVSYDGHPLPHVGTIFPEKNNEEQSASRMILYRTTQLSQQQYYLVPISGHGT